MVHVVCERLRHGYRPARFLLDIPRLALGPGVTGLVGVNGAGKTTLLRILSGALKPAEGSVTVDGIDMYGRHRAAVLRRAALMPQEYALPRDTTTREAVEYVGWVRGLSPRDAHTAAEEALAAVALADRAGGRVKRLSGGMLRRLALAQAMVVGPRLLLLDEPTTGLDPEQRVSLRSHVAALPRGATTVVSSHVMEDIEMLASRVLVVDTGRVLYHGPLDDFTARHGGPRRSAEHAFLSVVSRRREQP